MPSIYAAGPLAGQTYSQAQEWRRELAVQTHMDISVVSPLRGLEECLGLTDSAVGETIDSIADKTRNEPMLMPKSYTRRDLRDVAICDMMVANLLCAFAVSVGTTLELGYAAALGKPIVLIMEDDNPHNHPMLRELAWYVVPRVEGAARIANAMLARTLT